MYNICWGSYLTRNLQKQGLANDMTLKQWFYKLFSKTADTNKIADADKIADIQETVDTQTGNLHADKGSIVVGKAADGTRLTVNNISVSEEAIAAYANKLNLSQAEVEAVSDYLKDVETYYRYLPLKGMGDNSGLRLRFPLVGYQHNRCKCWVSASYNPAYANVTVPV